MRQGIQKRLGCLALSIGLLAGCAPQDPGESVTIFAMDTVMDLTAYGPESRAAVDAAVEEVNRLDGMLAAQRENSDIARVNARTEVSSPVKVDRETAELVDRTLALCADTSGALDITIYPAMVAWGFYDKNYRVPSETELTQLQTVVDHEMVWIDWLGTRPGGSPSICCAADVELDLGAVGKGYAADRVVTLWREMGVTSGLLSLGGNVHCVGARPDGSDWTVAIRDPEDPDGVLATVAGRDMAVVTSGAYQRNFTLDGKTYHHILDPKTCMPADSGAASVTVIGPSGFLCDGLSTALYVMGIDGAADYWRRHQDFDMVYYTQDGTLWYTSGLEGRLTFAQGKEGQALT